MRPSGIVVVPPAFDDDLGFSECVEDLAIQQLIAQPGIEAFDEAILPGASRRDVGRFGTGCCDPVLDSFGHELRAIIGTNVLRHTAHNEQVGQGIDHVDGL